ncbi:MAG: hypothetical protein V8S72_08525 [Oscillospiraceae bacterium]
MYLSVELTDTVYTGNKDTSSPGYVHFTFSFAVLQDAISITRKDVHFAERVLYERSSMYFVLWSIHHIFKGYNYTVKNIARSLSNHKILPRQFCAVCRFFSTIQALRGSNPPTANFFRLLCSVHLPQKVRGIFTLKTQKTGLSLAVIAIPKPVFSGFTVFWAVFALKARKLPDLSGRQIRQLIWRRRRDSNP